MTLLVTGGAGFIGANFILDWLATSDVPVINLDKLTYAGNPANLAGLAADGRHRLVQGDVADLSLVRSLLAEHRPGAIVHFAAETHVDRSIDGPAEFIQTNIVGTFTLLEAAREHWENALGRPAEGFRFLHVSTDEVYGDLPASTAPANECHRYEPNSPYAASKAASDHLARAWFQTYGLPVLTTHCSNNYGPFHYPEKLIPLMIVSALAGKPLSVYGDGLQVRDWLYVKDHCSALRRVLDAGRPGETYNIGGGNGKTNLETVHTLCDLLDELRPRADGRSYREQVTHVTDRRGHDRRYAIDAGRIGRELGWRPAESFESGLRKTVQWFLDHPGWFTQLPTGARHGS